MDESSSNYVEYKKEKSRYCPEGVQCRNQCCDYNEANHIDFKDMMCKFQSQCNRSECVFKHTVERAAFLGDCSQNYRKK